MGMHTFLAFCAEDDIQASVVEALYVLAVYEVINNYLLVVRRCEPTILEIHPARNSNVLGTSQWKPREVTYHSKQVCTFCK